MGCEFGEEAGIHRGSECSGWKCELDFKLDCGGDCDCDFKSYDGDGNDDCAYDDINCCCGGEVGTMRRVDLWWFEDLCSGYYLYLSE